MRAWVVIGAWLVAACGSAPPPEPATPPPTAPAPAPAAPPAAPEPKEAEDDIPDTATDEEPAPPPPEPPGPQPLSTASFEQATSTPEPIRKDDDHLHLTDQQLSNPMRGVIQKCKVPGSVRVTIKAAVQFGRAIGVTVMVEMPRLKQPKKPTEKSKKAAKVQAKAATRIKTCTDHAVRELNWPPSRRRDAITTTF